MQQPMIRSLVVATLIGVAATGAAATSATAAPLEPAAPQHAAIQPAVPRPAGCAVQSAELRWGVKESFRSYISGSIANGEWTVSDDMRYETPDFIWDRAQGALSDALDEGRVGFTGAVHFTGHDGAMQLDLADPAIEFAGDDTAYLVLNLGATDTANAGGEATAAEVRAAKIDLSGAVTAEGGDLEVVAAPVRLTAEGAEAFNGEYGSYVSGEELDPVSLTAATDCSFEASTAEEPAAPAETPDAAEAAEPQTEAADPGVPWVPIAVAGVALLVIGVTAGMLIAGRGKKDSTEDPTP